MSTTAPEKVQPRLKTRYREEIVPALREEFAFENVMMVPGLTKIVVNMGVGAALQQAKLKGDEALAADIIAFLGDKIGKMKQPRTIDFIVDLNQRVQQSVSYLIRLEPGVQTPEETLQKASGSCRDSGWLLVQIARHLGLAARFVSGYLIQLTPDEKALDGPSGTEVDFTDLHAWCEVYLPGAGWIGLDPTSGLFAGEGHIPLASTPNPAAAAPISGMVSPCEVEFDHEMYVRRIHEDPRVTKPYSDQQWQAIVDLGHRVDRELGLWRKIPRATDAAHHRAWRRRPPGTRRVFMALSQLRASPSAWP